MSAITLDLPEETLATVRGLAAEKHVPVESIFAEAIEWMAEAERQMAYLKARADRGRHVDIDVLMAKVPDVPPVPGDELE